MHSFSNVFLNKRNTYLIKGGSSMDIGGFIGGIIGIALLGFIIGVIIASFFMWIASKMAGLRDSGFGKAIKASLGVSFITWLVGILLGWIPIAGPILAFIVGIWASLAIIRNVYETTSGKAFLVWIFNIIAQIIALFLAAAILGTTLASILPF